MPIPATKIIASVRAALDAEGSEYYLDGVDLIPAINRAQNYLVSLITSSLGPKKFAEEFYRDLIKSRIFQTSQYSRVEVINANPAEKVWSILAVIVEPILNTPFIPLSAGGLSIPAPTYFYVSGGSSCERLNAEEWVSNASNPFKSGYALEPNTLNKDFAYLHFIDYFGANQPLVSNEIEIRPALNTQPVAINFVMVPKDVVAVTDNVDFPDSFFDIMVKGTLREVAFKQGDRTTISSLSSNDILTALQVNL